MSSFFREEIKEAFLEFYEEIKKDAIFFWLCGILIGWFNVIQSRSRELGIAKNSKWALELFSDFFSFHTFTLIFFLYIVFNYQKISKTVTHIELRLKQIASSIIIFLIGVLSFFFICSALNWDFSVFLGNFQTIF